MGHSGKKWGKYSSRTLVLAIKWGERVFLGSHQHTIDDKGRLTMPAKWRAELASGVVVTRGLEDCLFIFPKPRFEVWADDIYAKGLESIDNREWERYIFGLAEYVELDSQGRILIPQPLRTSLKFNGDVVVVGLYNRIEVWDPEKYAGMTERILSDPAALAERMRHMERGPKAPP